MWSVRCSAPMHAWREFTGVRECTGRVCVHPTSLTWNDGRASEERQVHKDTAEANAEAREAERRERCDRER